MIHGNMAVGPANDDLMIRVGPEMYESMRSRPHARPMDFTGKPLTGFLFVDSGGTRSNADLKRWIAKAVEFAKASPPKQKKADEGTGSKGP